MSSLSSQPGDLCFPRLRWCCTKGLGDFVPFLLLLPAVCAPEHNSTEGTSFPPHSCPQSAGGSSSFEVPAEPQQLRLNRPVLATAHLQSSAQVEMLSNSCQVTAPLAALGSVPGSPTLCAALLAPGSTEELWRAENRAESACRAFYDSRQSGLLKGPLCPLPDASGWNEHPFLTAFNPSCHGQHLQ